MKKEKYQDLDGDIMDKRVTLKQIAKLAGVSIGTVDRALNERGRISAETKQRILKIAEQLDYKPNVHASSLSKKRKLNIGIIMSCKPEEFCIHLMHGLKDALDEISTYGINTEFIFTDTLFYKDQMKAVSMLDTDKFDAFLVNAGSRQVGDWIDGIVKDGKSVVTFNSDIEECSRLCYVGENPYSAGLLVGNIINEILPEAKKIALFMGFKDNYSHSERCRGVKDAVISVNPNIKFLELEYQDAADYARQKMEQVLKDEPDIQAVFAASATGVWGIGQVVSEMQKDRRPKVFGYDVNNKVAELMDLNICQATVFQDPYWQGYYSMKILNEYLISKKPITQDKYIIRTKLVLKNNVKDYLLDRHQYEGFLL